MILCMRLEKKFTLLRDIAGGLVTVLPSTPTAESDFSQIKWEMNEFRSARTYFALEDFLVREQCKRTNACNRLDWQLVAALNNRRIAAERIASLP
jgi:hypothetical protein